MKRNSILSKTTFKISMIVISYLCVIAIAFGFAFYMSVYDSTGYQELSKIFSAGEENYVESDYFKDRCRDKIYLLRNYIKCQELFETDGIYDRNKIVSIEDMAKLCEYEVYMTPKEEEKALVSYRLGDLISWAETGLLYEKDESGFERITERYLPANGKSIYEQNLTEEQLEIVQNALNMTLSQLIDVFQRYRSLETELSGPNTNMKYFISDLSKGIVYTNTDFRQASDAEKELKGYGAYIAYNTKSKEYDTNMQVDYVYLRDSMGELSNIFSKDYVAIIAVDTEFPIQDNLCREDIPYEEIIPLVKLTMILMLIGICVLLTMLLLLTISFGVVPDSEEIQLNWFDRIKTGPAAFIIILLGGCSLILLNLVFLFDSSSTIYVIISRAVCISLFACVEYSWFLIGYSSLVKRIKAGTVWSNSLFKWFLDHIHGYGRSVKLQRKYAMYFFLIVGCNLFCGIQGPFFVIIAILADLYFGYRFMKAGADRQDIINGMKKITDGDLNYQLSTKGLDQENEELADCINHIREGLKNAVSQSVKNERLKTELITNVSHDIKTPLTSIINYVGLLKREHIEDERIEGYLNILEEKSQRLKTLTEDLIEASKVSSGNVTMNMEKINFVELINQAIGEFGEKFNASGLQIVTALPKGAVVIMADGRYLYRVLENLLVNVSKYALEGTRVYIDLEESDEKAVFSIKNISKQELNISADELTERFIRGDVSRSSEGSGLGLSIAKSLVEAQQGEFEIYLDGDLFKVCMTFIKIKE